MIWNPAWFRPLCSRTEKVESAGATGESHALKQPALTAVSKARFEKVIYQGSTVKVWGWRFYGY
jgi:hypothetical protein